MLGSEVVNIGFGVHWYRLRRPQVTLADGSVLVDDNEVRGTTGGQDDKASAAQHPARRCCECRRGADQRSTGD